MFLAAIRAPALAAPRHATFLGLTVPQALWREHRHWVNCDDCGGILQACLSANLRAPQTHRDLGGLVS
ncbi:MAG: hypothetical protein DWQ31_12095 [Planctomycetota bacterium]|nr:MAG: hypothetical protein DWQ31_12095 [Planctomycetota bacterium]REJ88029.1 MAG: hypothetical protein DWQ35_20525 [Planctomycetota bacterium]